MPLQKPRATVPLWAQIAGVLRQRIAQGQDTDFSDTALVAEFKVSPMTVRQAVQDLVAEGLLVRQRGRGTFIARTPVQGSLNSLERYLERWRFPGRDFRVEILKRNLVAANMWLASQLGVEPGTLVAYIRRRRFVDGYAVALDNRYLPADINADLSDEEILETGVMRLIQQRLAGRLRQATLTIRASTVSEEEAQLLGLAIGAPVLDRDLRLETEDGRIVMTGNSLYHPDRFVYAATFEIDSKTPRA
ncbi:MAG TPA: GntR family transcriptional regulator [Candidatus Baltobacteraceae bacterium]|jgi:GntR family transcriptional regulator